jgi:hypothetical protein
MNVMDNYSASVNEVTPEKRPVVDHQGKPLCAPSNVIPFTFEAKSVRVQNIDGSPWFCASDVCAILGYRNDSDAVKKHCRQAGVAKRDLSSGGQRRSLSFLDEGNLYRLIIKSRKEEAQRFEAWVCDEVLPAIRKHGRYVDSDNRMGTLIGKTIGTDGFHCLAALLDGKVRRLPAKIRRGAKNHIWSQVHKAFSVVSVEDIPASAMDSVRTFIAAYALEGEWLPKEAPVSGFGALIGRPLGRVERWMVSHDGNGQEQYQQLPDGACVLTHRDLMKAMTMPEIFVTTEDMFQFTMAALNVLKVRSEGQSSQLELLKRKVA